MKFVLTSLLLLAAFQVEASVKISHQLLNYREFKKLSRIDRADYIENLRLAAIQSENEQNHLFRNAKLSRTAWLNTLLRQAFAANGDMCIFAGYISRRNSQNYCAQPEGSAGNCGTGNTQCNPLLFGYGPSGNGFCTSSRTTPTNDCESQYQKTPNYKAYQVADQVVGHDMQKKFDDQSSELSTYCASSTSEGQKSICTKLLAKTSYMKDKLAAAESRKKSKESKVADAPPAKDTPKADPAVETAKPAPAQVAKPSSELTTPTPAAPPVAAPVAPSTPSTPAPAVVKKDDAPKPEVKKNLSRGNCITNKDDYDERKSKLPADFQNLDKDPLYYYGVRGGSEPQLGMNFKYEAKSVMKLEFKNGKMKLTTTLRTMAQQSLISSEMTPYDKYCWAPEDDVASVCPTADPKTFIVKLANETTVKITVGNGTINSSTKEGHMNYSKISSDKYESSRRTIAGTGLPVFKNGVKTDQVAK